MNRRKATLAAAGATFLLLVAGIAGGGFFASPRAESSQQGPPAATLSSAVALPVASGDTLTAPQASQDQTPRRATRDADDDDARGEHKSDRGGERHDEERSERGKR